MVGGRLAKDLLSFGKPIIAVGDPFQLPPINDEGAPFMEKPHALLTDIHRQAPGNPILKVAEAVREGRSWWRETDDNVVQYYDRLSCEEVADYHDVLICGTNRVRRATNQRLRKYLGFSGIPQRDEVVVCLHNDYECDVFNGETFWVESAEARSDYPAVALNLTNIVSDTAANVVVPNTFFEDGVAPEDEDEPPFEYQEFDYGYVLTAHKSQGSEWSAVAVVDESHVFARMSGREMARRWLYTAITRASERLTIADRSVR